MKTIKRLPIKEAIPSWLIQSKTKYVVGELIIKEDENGHFRTFPTYFDEKVELSEYNKIMGRNEI